MSYDQNGFNAFMDRSITADPRATTLQSLPDISQNSFNLDQLQVSGALGNTMQVGGSVEGGKVDKATLEDLQVDGVLTIGNKSFRIDGNSVQLLVSDGVNNRILIGEL